MWVTIQINSNQTNCSQECLRKFACPVEHALHVSCVVNNVIDQYIKSTHAHIQCHPAGRLVPILSKTDGHRLLTNERTARASPLINCRPEIVFHGALSQPWLASWRWRMPASVHISSMSNKVQMQLAWQNVLAQATHKSSQSSLWFGCSHCGQVAADRVLAGRARPQQIAL